MYNTISLISRCYEFGFNDSKGVKEMKKLESILNTVVFVIVLFAMVQSVASIGHAESLSLERHYSGLKSGSTV